MSELEKIYYNYTNDLSECGDSEAVIESRESLYKYLEEAGLKSRDYEDYVCNMASEMEKQGFLNGFRHAMKISLECMSKKIA